MVRKLRIVNNTFLSLFVGIGCISMVSTYKCYVCDNRINSECGDPFNEDAMTNNHKQEVLSGGVCMVCLNPKISVHLILLNVNIFLFGF